MFKEKKYNVLIKRMNSSSLTAPNFVFSRVISTINNSQLPKTNFPFKNSKLRLALLGFAILLFTVVSAQQFANMNFVNSTNSYLSGTYFPNSIFAETETTSDSEI